MSYLRKPDGEKRGKCRSTEEAATQKLKQQHHLMPASPSFSPLEQGEDKASYERHMRNLQQECKNVHPDKQVKALYVCMFSRPLVVQFPMYFVILKSVQISEFG